MWEAIVGGVVSGAVSGFAAGWFAASRATSSSATAGRDAPSGSASEGGTVIQAVGDGEHRQAGRDYIENPGPAERPNLRVDLVQEGRSRMIDLVNIGNARATNIGVDIDADAAIVRMNEAPESLDAGHRARIGLYVPTFGSTSARITMRYEDEYGTSFEVEHTLP